MGDKVMPCFKKKKKILCTRSKSLPTHLHSAHIYWSWACVNMSNLWVDPSWLMMSSGHVLHSRVNCWLPGGNEVFYNSFDSCCFEVLLQIMLLQCCIHTGSGRFATVYLHYTTNPIGSFSWCPMDRQQWHMTSHIRITCFLKTLQQQLLLNISRKPWLQENNKKSNKPAKRRLRKVCQPTPFSFNVYQPTWPSSCPTVSHHGTLSL